MNGPLPIPQSDTAHEQTGEKSRRLIESLEARLAGRTEELRRADRELDAFAHSVSHDLRAPLRAISGFGHFLTEEYASNFDDRGRGYLVRMMDAAAQMNGLIDDLLQFARASRLELQPAGVLGRVDFTCAPGLHAQGDPRLIRVVLMNLLDNAWKYTGKTAEPRVELGFTGDKKDTSFFIRDNGVGFDPRYADRLFGAFQRLHPVADFEGTGVGLATAQRIIHRHGGKIWAESKLNEGATFHFTLPTEGTP